MSASTSGSSYPGKRCLDLIVMVVIAAPVVVIGSMCALAIKTTSRGPVFFRQHRIGRHGQIFRIWKFRTMVEGDNPIIPAADRITGIGRLLRRMSLDELPQLINVATGDMSLVGPRPTLPYQADRWTDRQRRRLDARPGLTGLAQVGGRNDLSWEERIELDLEYLSSPSLWQDVHIMIRTSTVLLSGSGADATVAHDPIARVVEPAA